MPDTSPSFQRRDHIGRVLAREGISPAKSKLILFCRPSMDAGNMPLYSRNQVIIFPRTSVDNEGIELYTPDRVEAYLQLSSFVVPYNPVSGVTNNKSAFKAVFASNQSVPSLNDVIGTYVTQKVNKARARQYNITNGPYRRSRAEVRLYNEVMQKVETLCAKVLNDKRCLRLCWENAIAPYLRQIFSDLYATNEIARSFAKEFPCHPSGQPRIEDYVGKNRKSSFLAQHLGMGMPHSSDPFAVLSRVHTVILLDDSDSMSLPGDASQDTGDYDPYGVGEIDNSGLYETRWDQSRKLMASVVTKVSEYNKNGVDLHFLNRTTLYTGLQDESDVKKAFAAGIPSNWHGTPTGQRVHDILDAYLSTLRYYRHLMPLNLLVVTDGEATDEDTLYWSIKEHLTRLMERGYPAHQLGIEFVQVGDSESATKSLVKLEEEVSRHHASFHRDIVGITPASRISEMNSDLLLAISVSGIDARMNGFMRSRGINV